MLTRQKDMRVIGEAKDGEEACQLYDKLLPDILLMDLRMPKKDGLEVITELMSRTPSPLIIVMTTYEATEDIRLALTAGAKGYMLKDTESAQVCDTVRRVFAGESVLPPAVATNTRLDKKNCPFGRLKNPFPQIRIGTRELTEIAALRHSKMSRLSP